MASSNDIFIKTHRGSRELAWRTRRPGDGTNHPQGSWWCGEKASWWLGVGVGEYLWLSHLPGGPGEEVWALAPLVSTHLS